MEFESFRFFQTATGSHPLVRTILLHLDTGKPSKYSAPTAIRLLRRLGEHHIEPHDLGNLANWSIRKHGISSVSLLAKYNVLYIS